MGIRMTGHNSKEALKRQEALLLSSALGLGVGSIGLASSVLLHPEAILWMKHLSVASIVLTIFAFGLLLLGGLLYMSKVVVNSMVIEDIEPDSVVDIMPEELIEREEVFARVAYLKREIDNRVSDIEVHEQRIARFYFYSALFAFVSFMLSLFLILELSF